MAGLPKRNYGEQGGRLLADMRRSQADAEAEAASYTPDDPSQWASPPPTSLREALDRLARAGATNTWPA